MNEVPRVTIKAGTLSLAMMTPLTKPTIAAPPTPAASPTRTDGNSGTPELNAPRSARAERTEARLITHPTERSIPAAMMTKVWPRPNSSTGMIATRMFWELRTVRKLTEPPVVSGTATTKKSTIAARKAHAQMRLKKRAARCAGVSAPGGAAAWLGASLEARSVTGTPQDVGFGRLRESRRGRAPRPRRRSGLLARHLIDEAGDGRVFHVLLVDDRKAGLDAARQAGDAGGVGRCEHDRRIAHVERLLRQHQANRALVHELHRLLGCVIGDDLDIAAESRVDDRRARPLCAEHVGAEDAGEVRFARQHRRGLLRRLVGVVQIVVRTENLDVREVLRHLLLEALFATLDRADVGVGRVDVDCSFAADRLGEPTRRDPAALHVVGADVA